MEYLIKYGYFEFKYAKVSTDGIVNIYREDIREFNLTDAELDEIYNSLVWQKY